MAQSFPDAWHTGEGKIKILYGCEGYFLNNIDDRIAVHGVQDGDFSSEICCFDIETTGLKVASLSLIHISFCGSARTVSSTSATRSGPTSPRKNSTRRSLRIGSASGALAD